MTAYIIAKFDIHSRADYDKYEEGFGEVFAQFDGKMLSVDEAPTVLEGEWTATRSVLIEFPSKQSAYAWMQSDAYRAIAVHRAAGSTATAILVEGYVPEET